MYHAFFNSFAKNAYLLYKIFPIYETIRRLSKLLNNMSWSSNSRQQKVSKFNIKKCWRYTPLYFQCRTMLNKTNESFITFRMPHEFIYSTSQSPNVKHIAIQASMYTRKDIQKWFCNIMKRAHIHTYINDITLQSSTVRQFYFIAMLTLVSFSFPTSCVVVYIFVCISTSA